MRLMLASIVCEKRALDQNLAAHLDVIGSAQRSGCDLVVFPEFSLTGSVDARTDPAFAISLDDPAIANLTAATAAGPAAVFGIAERWDTQLFITQVAARDGHVVGFQRKRHLGEGEEGFDVGTDAFVFDMDAHRVGTVICAEAGVDRTWDGTRTAGADLVCMCSAPGLYERRTDEQAWRDGFEWWESCGLADARHHARRLGVWVALATQAGATVDEDFPGIAALVSPRGEIVDRLPDWHPDTLTVELP